MIGAVLELLIPLTWPVDPRAVGAAEQMGFVGRYKILLSRPDILGVLFQFIINPLAVNYRYVCAGCVYIASTDNDFVNKGSIAERFR